MLLRTFNVPHLSDTEALAVSLSPYLSCGDCVALEGGLGAGKTSFARALIHALGAMDEVPSPTFTILQVYELPKLTIYHFDLYRVQSESELEELGWQEALGTGLVIVEWPSHAGHQLPLSSLTLDFQMSAQGDRFCQLKADEIWTDRLRTLV